MNEIQVEIREAVPEDAAAIINYMQQLSNEPDIMIGLSPGEFTHTLEEEQQILKDFAASENSAYFIALIQGEIVGILNLHGGKRRTTYHSATLGISIRKGWRNLGIGNRLMDQALRWARDNPVLSRIELGVYVENVSAIHLYEKYGFVIEGRLRKSTFRDGEYHDGFIMGLVW